MKKKRYQQISGDVDSWTFGGTFLDTKNNTLVHCPGVDGNPHLDQIGMSDHGFKIYIYETSNDSTKDEWFSSRDVSNFVGIELAEWELQTDAQKWDDVARYYGWYELDQYPVEMNKSEWRKMVGDYAG